MLLLLACLAHASDHDDSAHIPTHLGIDVIVSAPDVETAAAAHGLVTFPLVKHVGLSVFARATTHEYYGEIYLGPAFRIGHLTLTPSLGIETSDMPLRAAGSCDWSTDRVHLLAVVEYGGSGVWYHGLANFWIKPIGVGVFAQRFDGIGPWVDLHLSSHFDLWTAGLYDPEDRRLGGMAGLDWHH